MSETLRDAEILDRAAYQVAANGFREIQSHLPESAVRTLAEEVVARLARRHGKEAELAQSAELDAFCHALIGEDPGAGADWIETRRLDEGDGVERIYLTYLAAAARRLGFWWETDRASFADVTIGTSRLYAIMRSLRGLAPASGAAGGAGCVLLAAVPGEEHTLGVTMATDLARQNGWEVEGVTGADHDEIVERVRGGGYAAVGLSCACERTYPALARLIVGLRLARPGVRVVVSGQYGRIAPAAISRLEPDGWAPELPAAFALLEEFAGRRARAD